MAFAEPLFVYQSGLNPATGLSLSGITTAEYRRLRDGEYIGSNAGTLDEPLRFFITNNLNYNGTSTYKLRSERYKNVPSVNGIVQKDDVLRVDLGISLPHRSFTATDAQAEVMKVAFFLLQGASSGTMERLLRGER